MRPVFTRGEVIAYPSDGEPAALARKAARALAELRLGGVANIGVANIGVANIGDGQALLRHPAFATPAGHT